MSARAGFRPRPLDLTKQITVVRNKDELDPPVDGAKDVLHLVQQREEEAKRPKKRSEIPIPMVRELPSYERDYLPVFREGNTYIRGRGGVGHKDDNFVEYDLDQEDRDWLKKFNGDQDRLSSQRFELLLWKLEMVNAEANDRHSAATGSGMPDRISPAIVAQIGNLKKEEALQAMSRTHALRHPTLLAIYTYWRDKRGKRGRPLLRTLQAPTAPSDGNPYNVFRPRDKVHRPQTRKRRENNEESLEKMKALRQNLVRGYEILEWVCRREQHKCNITYLEADENHLAVLTRHESFAAQEDIEARYSRQLKFKAPKRPLHVAQATHTDNPWDLTSDFSSLDRFKRRKLNSRKEVILSVQQLPSPPASPEPEMLFTQSVDDIDLPEALKEVSQTNGNLSSQINGGALEDLTNHKAVRRRGRIGRGGRICFDRCDAFSELPFLDESESSALGSQPDPSSILGAEIKQEADLYSSQSIGNAVGNGFVR